jgi:hypothetical protein
MDPTQQGAGGWQTLASVLAGGLGGYVDAQNNQPVYVQTPAPQTAYGYAGQGQVTPTTSSLSPTVLLVGVILVAAVFMLKK